MSGARPLYLSAAFIIEEGFAVEDLRRVLASMRAAAEEAGVSVVTGDKVILSGGLGDHGTTVMIARGELELETEIESDTAPLGSLVREMLDEAARAGDYNMIRAMRDPTRGGVATTLNEIASASDVYVEINEDLIPVREEVRGACEILGLDPLYVANEGKLMAVVAAGVAERGGTL